MRDLESWVAYQGSEKAVPIFQCKENRGKGAAIRLGLEQVTGEFVVKIQMPIVEKGFVFSPNATDSTWTGTGHR